MTRVFIIDDSAVVRQSLTRIFEATDDLEVVGVAMDPLFAWRKLPELNPDVITLDVEMPRMGGLEFLEKLMAERPTPVIMVSSLTEHGANTTFQALARGAVDFVTKPSTHEGLAALAEELCSKVRAAARSRPRRRVIAKTAVTAPLGAPPEERHRTDEVLPLRAQRGATSAERLVVIGASTGGTVALEEVLTHLSLEAPPIVIVQHMPQGYTRAFAGRLDGLAQVEVLEAEPGLEVRRGRAIVARGGAHTLVQRTSRGLVVQVKDAPPVNRHRPSVDVLFRSAANVAASGTLGVLLTGMGDDGARGLLELRQAGAETVAQDEESCVVYGMPRVAVELGAAQRSLPLTYIAAAIERWGR